MLVYVKIFLHFMLKGNKRAVFISTQEPIDDVYMW